MYRRRDSSSGFRMELENLVCDGKGKGTSGRTEAESTDAQWSEGSGPPASRSIRVNWQQEEPAGQGGRAAALNEWHEPDKSRDLRPVL